MYIKNSKQRSILIKIASNINTSFNIGKNGISDSYFDAIDKHLTANEIVKIQLLKNNDDEIKNIANELAKYTNADIVKIIGKKIILYRPSENNIIVF